MNYVTEDILMHYGVGHKDGGHSGRYPWGSGEIPFQHAKDFLNAIYEKRAANFTWTDPKTGKVYTGDTAIAKSMHLSTDTFRTQLTLAKNEERMALYNKAKRLQEEGYGATEIARKLGMKNESSVRSLLDEKSAMNMTSAQRLAEKLKDEIDAKGMIDVGSGMELYMGVSEKTLKDALYVLSREGYPTYGGRVDQATNKGMKTTLRVVCPPGTEASEIYNFENIHDYGNFITYNNGESFVKSFNFPSSLDPSRLKIRYADEGGLEKDGTIELRRGVDDISLGGDHYSQIRMLVNGSHYLKGMAVYGPDEDFPDGVDVIFNTNKNADVPIFGSKDNTVLKPVKRLANGDIDADNPFGSLIKEHGGQSFYDDPDGDFTDPITGKKQSLSLINKRAAEGDWNDWADKVPSQFLSKQPVALIKKQLKITIEDKQDEYNEIMSLTNPTIKRKMLEDFAEDCDSAAEHLKAAALPRQKYQVILPINSLKDTEIYAPNYENGEQVALVRFPHGGRFEMPILTVNNKNKEGDSYITKQAADAVGINKKVADRLSGADFDGDTVMVIPVNEKVPIKSANPLKGLEGFDPKEKYPGYDGMKKMKNTQLEMGVVSNLITDMTLKDATNDELARAVRHSMVVIDAEKHGLDYKKSESDNGIQELKDKYQAHIDPKTGKTVRGASTLISRAKNEVNVDKRRGSPIVNPDGSLSYKTAYDIEYTQVYNPTSKKWRSTFTKNGDLYYKEGNEYIKVKSTDKTRVQRSTQKSTQMREATDAFDLVSDKNTPTERAYASYANKMKALANESRKQAKYEVGKLDHDKEAAKTYEQEVASLKAKYNTARMNAPKERKAQLIANTEIEKKKKENPDLYSKPGDVRKLSQKEITKARNALGIPNRKERMIDITDSEWEAVQKGAISDSMLYNMLKYTDSDALKERATPRTSNAISTTKIQRIKSLSASGYTPAEIAKRLGVSTSTVQKYMK